MEMESYPRPRARPRPRPLTPNMMKNANTSFAEWK